MSSLDLSLVTGHQSIGIDAAASSGVTVVVPGTANTKGAWIQLTAATSGDASWIEITLSWLSSGDRYLVDIGIGASGSEVVLIPNLHLENAASSNSGALYRFPVAIPAGSRVSARAQWSGATIQGVRVSAVLGLGDPGGLTPPGSVQAYGVSTGDSGLTAVDPGATANTDSAWVELTAATTAAARWLVVAFGHDAAAITAGCRFLVDIATGASGSEVELLSDLFTVAGLQEDSPNPRTYAFPVNLASGTRIAARARCSNNATPNRLLDVAVYLADAAAPAGGGGGASAHAFAAWSG